MSWSQIGGQDEALRRLRAAKAQGRLAHAFALVGPAGVGKRRFANELAKAFLCEAKQIQTSLDACGVCPACKLVASETHPDFHVARTPEEKSELPVEVIRNLLEKVVLKPARGHGMVLFLEDADDFNEESANAFLKTLEEPPAGVEIILRSTGFERLLPTIRSRVQVLPFQPLPTMLLDELLQAHGITDEATRQFLLEHADGSLGRALALNQPAVKAFHEALTKQLNQSKPNTVQLAKEWMAFAEGAGREVPAQRARANLAIPMILQQLRRKLTNAIASGDAVEIHKVEKQIEACLQAQYLFDRRVQIVLVVEQCADQLCAI